MKRLGSKGTSYLNSLSNILDKRLRNQELRRVSAFPQVSLKLNILYTDMARFFSRFKYEELK